jgi:CheY-like chemotaxis protein
LSLRVDSEQTERPSLGSPDLNRLDEFAELARAAQVNLTFVVERTVVGFDLELTSAAHNQVLVVDDNELIIELIRRYLVPRGYEVASAPSADRALELAEQMHPFAMTVDLMMPDRDGWDLLKALLQRPTTRDIPVIVCSVLRQKELALSLGATAFLEKPVKEDELLAVLTALDSP